MSRRGVRYQYVRPEDQGYTTGFVAYPVATLVAIRQPAHTSSVGDRYATHVAAGHPALESTTLAVTSPLSSTVAIMSGAPTNRDGEPHGDESTGCIAHHTHVVCKLSSEDGMPRMCSRVLQDPTGYGQPYDCIATFAMARAAIDDTIPLVFIVWVHYKVSEKPGAGVACLY